LLGSGFQRWTFHFLSFPELSPASDQGSKLLYDWWFSANQFFLASSPLRITFRDVFPQLNPCGNSPYVTLSLTKRWDCLLWICLAFRQMCISHFIEKFLLLHYTQSSVSTGFTEPFMPLLLILCYTGSLVTWTVVSLTTAKFEPPVFSTSGSTLSYTAKMFILMIPYDFCLFPAQFCYIIVHIRKVKSCMQIADRPRHIVLERTAKKTSLPLLCTLVVGETSPQSCFLATAFVLSPVYIAVTWQWVYLSQYDGGSSGFIFLN
jgi:hypothetical protein